jgi:hypothetical protein
MFYLGGGGNKIYDLFLFLLRCVGCATWESTCYNISMIYLSGKKPLAKPELRWKNYIKMNRKEIPHDRFSLFHIKNFAVVQADVSVSLLKDGFVGFQVEVFWILTPCSVAVRYQCFGGPYCLHRQSEDLRDMELRHRDNFTFT